MIYAGGAAFVTRLLDVLWSQGHTIQQVRSAGRCSLDLRCPLVPAPIHHRSDLAPSAAPSAVTTMIDNPYHAATNSGESSGQCNA